MGRVLGEEEAVSEDLPKGTWVRLLPQELKGVEGKVLWRNGGSQGPYVVLVPYGTKGAVIYVDVADIEAIREEEPREPFPIARIANDIITQHLGMLTLVDLKVLISRAWAGYDELSHDDQHVVLRDVARKIYGGS